MENVPGIKSWITAWVITILLLSPYTYQLFTIANSYLFEIPIILSTSIIFLIKSKLSNAIKYSFEISSSKIILSAMFIFAIFILGLISYLAPTASYADARSNFIVIFGFLITTIIIKINKDVLITLATTTTLLNLIHWIHQYSINNLEAKYPSPLFAPVLGCLLSVNKRDYKLTLFFTLSTIFLASISGLRQYWPIALLLLIYSVINVVQEKKISILNIFLVIFILLISTHLLTDFIWEFLNRDESTYIQSIGKAIDLIDWINGGSAIESDALRVAYYTYILENWYNLILPHGLGHSAHGIHFDSWFYKISDASNTLDSIILFISYQYGLITLIPLAFYIIAKFKHNIKSDRLFNNIIVFLILMIPLLFDGGQLTVTIRAFWFGSFVAYTVSKKQNSTLLHQ